MPIQKKIPTLEEVNALISNAEITGDYLPLSGGTLTGKLTIDDSTAFSQGDENVVYKVRVKTGSSQTGAISFGKEGSNSGSMVKFEQKEGTTRLLFRASNTPGAMVWQQPESGSTLYFDVDNIQYRLKDDGNSKGYKLDKNAFMPNKNNVGSLGDSTHNFQYLYASTIFENNTSLADKYSPKTHTHIQYLEKTDVSGTVIGSSKSLYKVTGQMYASSGIVFGGSAAQAGLVTRGVCGISTPDSDGNCEKENLYLNYDGSDTYSSSRQVVIQAGSVGTHYGNNLYQYAAARGDAVKNYADSHYAAKSHSHSISNISGLQTELNSKLDKQDIYSDGVNAGNDDVLTKGGVAMFIELELKGTVNGLASLDSSGKVPSSQLPSYVDDILDYSSRNSFPATGEDGKIYIAEDTNKQYRWSGTTYVEISSSLALGETSSTAYAGNKGKANADAIAALQTGKANASHTHTIANITNLQTSLDGKLNAQDPSFNGTIYGAKWSGQTGTSSDNHAIIIGANQKDYCDFLEYGAVWNFYKSIEGTKTLVAKIQEDGIYHNNTKLSKEGHKHKVSDVEGLAYDLQVRPTRDDFYSDSESASDEDYLTKQGVKMCVLTELAGQKSGVASLGADGKVPASQLPTSSGGGGATFTRVQLSIDGGTLYFLELGDFEFAELYLDPCPVRGYSLTIYAGSSSNAIKTISSDTPSTIRVWKDIYNGDYHYQILDNDTGVDTYSVGGRGASIGFEGTFPSSSTSVAHGYTIKF